MSRILLGVSGGIAAYKALEVVRGATAHGHAVRVIQTPASERFVGRASFAAISGAPVLTDEFERDPARGTFPGDPAPDHDPISHLALVANSDVYLIAPASANTLAKLAHGLADNLLTSAALAARCPVIVAPAMNHHMWEHAATQANLEILRAREIEVVPPQTGRLASPGEWGTGRLAEPGVLLAACEASIAARAGQRAAPLPPPAGDRAHDADWRALRVLVSAGGTREPIDSVRFIGNRSSGRMGFALAEAARDRGAQVTVVAANVALARRPDIEYQDVSTAEELRGACLAAFETCDVLLMAAAVADFRPLRVIDEKLRKAGRDRLELTLESTPDVLSELAGARRPGQTVVGFAAEHGDGAIESARDKLARKGLDAIVVNDISRAEIGFDRPENEVTIITAAGERHVPRAAKAVIAATVLDTVAVLRGGAA